MTYKAIVKIEVGELGRQDAGEVAAALAEVVQMIVVLPGFPGLPSVAFTTEGEEA